jgi:predicted ATPase/class 3 adenylate cyclase
MRELPTGTVTFLFTDIEGSTRLLQELGTDGYAQLQERHAAILRAAIARGRGVGVRTEGDSFFAVFPLPSGAIGAAVEAQRAIATDVPTMRVRMGLHTGEGVLGGDDYVGIEVNRAARIAATGHGGQIVLSATTQRLVANALPDGITIRSLGEHRLKDLPEAEELYDVLIDGASADHPPLRSLGGPRTNLPPPRTSFVGRRREIAAIDELLRTHRVLTLTGPGGTGKTRLASKVAADQVARYADGVWFVDLSAVTDPALVLPEIARVIGARETPGHDPAEAVREHLREREMLLVLDNLEQLVDAGPAIASLLDAAPGLTILGTSRVALRVSGEQEYRVDPLDVPEPDRPVDAAELAAYGSVRLFAERASSVRQGFLVTEETAPAVAQIVARLDGLPLALELAASRMRILSPNDLAVRLDHSLTVLTGGARDAPERQRTLAGAIRWGYDLLEPDQRRLFARLSVFSGGWTLEAAEVVCGSDLDVLDDLGALVDASLVRRIELDDGQLRFSMLETIREFAAELLETSEERAAVRHHHAEWCRDLAEHAEPHLTGEDQLRWLEILDREHDNVRAVLDRAEQEEDARGVEAGLRIAAAIWRFWQQGGHLAEGRARLERLLALDDAQQRDAVRARALGALGGVAYWLGDLEAVEAAYREAVEILREVGDRHLLAQALFDLGFVPLMARGDAKQSTALIRESLATAPEDDLALRGRIWNGIGFLESFAGNDAGGIDALERGIALHRQVGERFALCEALIGMAGILFVQGNLPAARPYLEEATRVAGGSPSPILVAMMVLPHAVLANHEGDPDRAARLVGAWARIERDSDLRFPDQAPVQYDDAEDHARASLGDDAFARARAEGFAMSTDQVVDLLMEVVPPGGSFP